MNHTNNRFPYKKILVVCSVNTARSRISEGFLRDFFSRNAMDVSVSSGGIASNARDGMLISLDAKLVMKEIGIPLSDDSLSVDLKKHPEAMQEVDLILTLTEKHKEEIYSNFTLENKAIFTLREFAGETGDIEDPSMKGGEGFRKARDEIINCIVRGMKKYE
jgi:protein-tyrosine-phosphatase